MNILRLCLNMPLSNGKHRRSNLSRSMTIVAFGHLRDQLVNFWPFNNFIETVPKSLKLTFITLTSSFVIFCVLNWVPIHSVIILIALNIFLLLKTEENAWCFWVIIIPLNLSVPRPPASFSDSQCIFLGGSTVDLSHSLLFTMSWDIQRSAEEQWK